MPATDPVQALADVVQSRAISIEDAWAVMEAARPLIAAEALREAAGHYSHMYPPRGPGMPVAVVTVADLEDRADRIEREEDE